MKNLLAGAIFSVVLKVKCFSESIDDVDDVVCEDEF